MEIETSIFPTGLLGLRPIWPHLSLLLLLLLFIVIVIYCYSFFCYCSIWPPGPETNLASHVSPLTLVTQHWWIDGRVRSGSRVLIQDWVQMRKKQKPGRIKFITEFLGCKRSWHILHSFYRDLLSFWNITMISYSWDISFWNRWVFKIIASITTLHNHCWIFIVMSILENIASNEEEKNLTRNYFL